MCSKWFNYQYKYFVVSSFVELVLSQLGVNFLSEKLCQYPLEKFFGLQRQRGKSNDNPSVNEVQKNSQALRVIGDINVNQLLEIAEERNGVLLLLM